MRGRAGIAAVLIGAVAAAAPAAAQGIGPRGTPTPGPRSAVVAPVVVAPVVVAPVVPGRTGSRGGPAPTTTTTTTTIVTIREGRPAAGFGGGPAVTGFGSRRAGDRTIRIDVQTSGPPAPPPR
jgi:hypothetical protein